MPAEGAQFKDKIVTLSKRIVRGLVAFAEGVGAQAANPDACMFEVWTGTTGLPDVPFTNATYTLLADKDVPTGCKCYITSIEISVQGATVWSGGTAGVVSLTIEDTAGTDIATFTQTALAVAQPCYYAIPFVGSAPTGVSDVSNLTRSMGASTAVNKGIQATTANSSAGSSVRVRIRGYFAP